MCQGETSPQKGKRPAVEPCPLRAAAPVPREHAREVSHRACPPGPGSRAAHKVSKLAGSPVELGLADLHPPYPQSIMMSYGLLLDWIKEIWGNINLRWKGPYSSPYSP